jgi:hypothetical protein
MFKTDKQIHSMFFFKMIIPVSLFTYLSVSFIACEKTSIPEDIQISFTFDHKIGADALELDTIKYTNLAGNKYSVARLKYFVSDITLHKTGGGTVLIDDEHYINASDANTLSFAPAMAIPNGNYSQISFVLGLDTIKNISNAYLNPPQSDMAWPDPMGGGYHYMKLEGKYNDSLGVPANYNIHTGELMGNPYYVDVTLSGSSFSAEGVNLNVAVKMDINKWYENPNTYDFSVYGSAIMNNMNAQNAIKQNGADVFTLSSIQ